MSQIQIVKLFYDSSGKFKGLWDRYHLALINCAVGIMHCIFMICFLTLHCLMWSFCFTSIPDQLCFVLSQIINVLWWYYFSKLIEFMDTFFFILRKNNHQITFLHIYHHATMLNIWWFVMNWIPCGHCECCTTTLPSSDANRSGNHI